MTLTMRGVYTALVTPFTASGEIDWAAYEKLVERQVAAGVAGVVPVGTTGESPTLTKDEKHKVISEAIRIVNKRCQVVAGTGSNNTADSVAETKWAKEAGADACLIVNPYYNKPSQAGLIAHVKAIAAVGLPVVLYNIPGRSGVAMTTATIAELARVPGVVALKDAAGSVDGTSDVVAATAGSGLAVLSGDDPLTLPMMAVGAVGVVSVLSNVAPEKLVALVAAANGGDYTTARRLHYELLHVAKTLFVEVNPVPAKRALELLGLIGCSGVRLPLVGLAADSDAKLTAALKGAGLL